METFSALLAICAGNSPVPGEFPAQRPVTRSFDVFVDLCPNKRLGKQPWGWGFETPSHPVWRHCNEHFPYKHAVLLCNLLFWSACLLVGATVSSPQCQRRIMKDVGRFNLAQTGFILCMVSANERRRYSVTPSFFGWAHTCSEWTLSQPEQTTRKCQPCACFWPGNVVK